MIHERPAIERRVLAALDSEPARMPVVVGGCGCGRTSLLTRVAARLGDVRSRYIDVERIASTPERFLAAVVRDSRSGPGETPPVPAGRHAPRAAFDALLAFLGRRHGSPHVLLLDEWLELRILESFPGLRGALHEVVETLARSPQRFVLASRFVNRTRRFVGEFSSRIDLIRLPPLSPSEVIAALRSSPAGFDDPRRSEIGALLQTLAAGRPGYVDALAAGLSSPEGRRGDVVGVLAAQMASGAPLSQRCRFSYELRLHRARGYGALKAILGVLAEREPLTLTEIARLLGRTPGATKDYLSWLEDVDLIEPLEKRYRYADPLLRLWVRLHGGPAAPDGRERARQVDKYAAERLADAKTTTTASTPPRVALPRRPQDLMEID